MFARFSWILWNLFLAGIPVALGYAIGSLGRQATIYRRPWLWLALAPLIVLWFIFLPNSCYLFTEPRHFFAAVERYGLWSRARHDPRAAMGVGLRAGVALVYSAAGALTFALSIRPVKAWIRALGIPTSWGALPFFMLVSLGVYLGLVVRYNSWDLFTRPGDVLVTVAGVTDRPLLLLTIVCFGLFLWLAYEVNDIWIDGFALRWARWTRREPKETRDELLSAAGRR
jgi:uncharacterized membrane protein